MVLRAKTTMWSQGGPLTTSEEVIKGYQISLWFLHRVAANDDITTSLRDGSEAWLALIPNVLLITLAAGQAGRRR